MLDWRSKLRFITATNKRAQVILNGTNTSPPACLLPAKALIFKLSANHHICVVFKSHCHELKSASAHLAESTSGKMNNVALQHGFKRNKEFTL